MASQNPQLHNMMKITGIIGAIVGFTLFGVAYITFHSLVHLILIPITACIGYYIPSLLEFSEED